jgi:hypothetical protein
MIWHILKKDFKLLWVFGLAVAAMPFAIVAVHLKLGHFEEDEIFRSLLLLLEIAMYFGIASLIAALIHQDAIVGMRQDWLVRPIKRRDLLAAKFLFLVCAVQLPMLLADIAGGLANGFAFSQSLSAALSQNLYFLIGFTLPILAFASLTKSMTEALGGAFVIFIGIMGLEVVVSGLSGGKPLGPTTNTGIAWIPLTGRLLIYLLGGAVILGLQYFRRATRIARLVFVAVVVFCLITEILPWRYVFGLQKALSKSPAYDNKIALRFDPGAGKFRSPVSVQVQPDFRSNEHAKTGGGTEIYIPLAISGLPGGSIVKVDRAVARMVSADGKSVRNLSVSGDIGDFEVENNQGTASTSIPYYEPIHVRGDLYNRLKDTAITLQVDYSVTLLNVFTTNTLAALDGNQRIPNVGWCETQLNDSRTAVQLRCLEVGNPPHCTSAVLENPNTGSQDPSARGCLDDYAPYFGRYRPPDTIMHTGTDLYFRDPADLVHYPVDGSQIGSSKVVMKTYVAADHFTARVVIPAVRLSDWYAP